eukprot:ANDGO_05265.mRNA.1 hypothetical protein PHYSODRAFT_457372
MGGSLGIKDKWFSEKRPKVTKGGKPSSEFKCCKCDEWVSNHPERMYNHVFVHCKNVTETDRDMLLTSLPVGEVENWAPMRFRKRARAASSTEDFSGNRSQLEDMFEQAEVKKTMLDRSLCDALVSANIPFHVLENIKIQAFLSHLGYTAPSPSTVHRRILPETVCLARHKIVEKIRKTEFLTLSSDTWSNQRNESITNCVAICDGEAVFFGAEHSPMQSKTAEYYALFLDKAISLHNIHDKVAGIVTDNASVMHKSWRLLQPKYPETLFVGCHAHMLNLFFNDVFSKIKCRPVSSRNLETASQTVEMDDVVREVELEDDLELDDSIAGNDNALNGVKFSDISPGEYSLPQIAFVAQKITTFFRRYQVAGDALRAKQTESKLRGLQMPGRTRWGSVMKCISRVYENREAIVSLIRDCGQVRQKMRNVTLRRLIENDATIWQSMKAVIDAFNPLSSLLKVIESNTCDISSAFHFMHEFEQHLSQSDLVKEFPEVLQCFQQRMERLSDDRILVAYSLDPRYQKKHLTEIHISRIARHMLTRPEDEDREYYAFQAVLDNGFINDHDEELVWNRAGGSVITFWRRMRFFGPKWKIISKVALRLLSVICNSASTERVWSNFSFIHSKTRNRLSTKKTIELALVYAWNNRHQLSSPCRFDISQFSMSGQVADDDDDVADTSSISSISDQEAEMSESGPVTVFLEQDTPSAWSFEDEADSSAAMLQP